MMGFSSEKVSGEEKFLAYWDQKKSLIDKALDKFLPQDDVSPLVIHQAMRYAVFPGGKRLRPVLVLAAAEAVGDESLEILPVACALELIHCYSLVHDDLPALDDDDYRRGKPSVHKKFGEDIAILTGDALLTLSFELLSEVKSKGGELINEVARAIGTAGMIGGQVDDLRAEGQDLTLSELESIHFRKTSALIELCLKSGAVLGGGNEEEITALSRYGRCVGLAFQISDDIMDDGDEPGKNTYPALLNMEMSRDKVKELVEEAVSRLTFFEDRGNFLKEVAELIHRRSNVPKD